MSGTVQRYPVFPLTVQFEDGEEEDYVSVEDLEMNLKEFDPDLNEGCRVTDALGRPVRLKVKMQRIKALSLRGGR